MSAQPEAILENNQLTQTQGFKKELLQQMFMQGFEKLVRTFFLIDA